MQLIADLRRGNAPAFTEAYTQHRAVLFAFLMRLCRNRAVAEDLFQNTWLKLAKHATRLQPDTKLRAWLLTVARNEFRSHRRWQIVDVSRLFELGQSPEHVEAQADLNDEVRALEVAMGKLRPSDREILWLVAVDGIDGEAAAEVLGTSYATFRKRLSRARARLESHMATGSSGRMPLGVRM